MTFGLRSPLAAAALNRARQVLMSLAPGSNRALLEAIAKQVAENQVILNRLTLPNEDAWRGQPPLIEGEPPLGVFPQCTVCRQESFEAPYFSYWSQRIGQPLRYHRKLWEFVFICQALFERGMLQTGLRGLGFGVGGEPLPAYFASQGCQVLATDMAAEDAQEAGWVKTGQFAGGAQALQTPSICSPELFERNVSFRTADMNRLPDDLRGFDFCWSACALEHLGSLEKGLAFIERSVDTLRPGGVAVHTTELNTSSDSRTVGSGATVLFRRRDLEMLAARLAAKGHVMAPLDLDMGLGPVDRYLDVPPYRAEPHLSMLLSGFATTSVGIIVQRGA